MKIGFIGCGKMGSSILYGVEGKIFNTKDIFVCEKDEKIRLNFIREGINVVASLTPLCKEVDVILLAVKPQDFAFVLENLRGQVDGKLIITIAAGITTSFIEDYLGSVKVARAMPNTAALIGEASSVVCFNSFLTEEDKSLVLKIFETIGKVIEIDENQMDDIIPIGGSFTAYQYYFYKGFLESSVKRGIDEKVAKKVLIQSIIGSAKMIESQNKSIDELISDVCSKGGTTLAGLKEFEDNNLLKIIDDCASSCANRSKELGKKD
ncbi:MAG: pyrroline-5-carboxylate reductase [Clostridiales bacterium]|nr:pyrroline-5-carboxylate reductase [Clostridiales bacterium]